jgi:cystathionine beta-lyase/cystathionine gamma-synthase
MANQKIGTLAVHGGEDQVWTVDAVNTPIYQSTTYRFDTAAAAAAYLDAPEGKWLYSRLENPTVVAAERKLALLEGTEQAALFASGMAAIHAALVAHLAAGDTLLVADALYGQTTRLARTILARFGVRVLEAPVQRLAEAAAAAPDGTRAVFFETPTNPTLRIADVAAVAAACRARGILSMIDATFATPINLRPASLGVDLVIHSATKYLNGHCEHLAGVVAGNTQVLAPVLEVRRTAGGTIDPVVASDLARGMKTLEIRIERQNATALRLAEALERHPRVARVHYPFLASHPDHGLARRLLRGGGGVLSLSVKGGFEACGRVHDALRLVARASSLGGVESLASIPVISSHRNATDAELAAQGIDRGMLRLSVGLEDADDLLADLTQALERA